jgi:sulfide:quinone oxidoreductase
MELKQIDSTFSVASQVLLEDVPQLVEAGFKTLVCNRPDGEGADQPNYAELEEAAMAYGLDCVYLPVTSGKVADDDAAHFAKTLAALPTPALAYCRTGTRSMTLWAIAEGRKGRAITEIVELAKAAGYDMSSVAQRLTRPEDAPPEADNSAAFDVVIVGGGAAGIAAAASLLARTQRLSIAIIDPAQIHYYQPGWTLVGAGVFTQASTVKTMASLIPKGVQWIEAAVAGFEPEQNCVVLENCQRVRYQRLVVAPGLKLNWQAVEGLTETLGQHGVTSNYRFDLAPYTWQLVQELKHGRALFTQPPMPIKCAGAPQKAMYLSADYWHRSGCLENIEVAFHTAGPVLFGVKEYVPALMKYVEKYNAQLNFGQNLTRIDGPARTAWFKCVDAAGNEQLVAEEFDIIHVCPPQTAPDFIATSALADAAGWVDVDQNTLRHQRYDNIWSLGDVMNAPNAKTAAAARMQAPVLANNLLQDAGLSDGVAHYNGYGSCPLTVERGKIVLAEFGYGGKLTPSFPRWLIDGTRPSRLAWLLKEKILPPIYWKAMLQGREWLATPSPHAAPEQTEQQVK